MVEYVKDGMSKADLLDKHNHAVNVVGDNNNIIGSIDLKKVASAIARPAIEQTADTTYR